MENARKEYRFQGMLENILMINVTSVKPRYEIRYEYDTAPIRRYGKVSKIKIRYGWDTLIKNYIIKYII
jgi:hypothetical protein